MEFAQPWFKWLRKRKSVYLLVIAEQIEENENCKVNVFGNSNSNAYTECCSKKKMHIQSKRRDKNVLINNVKDNMSFFMESVHVEDNILI
jgi:hypothetical protein